MERGHVKSGLHVVSVFEAAKGLLVLLPGFGLPAYSVAEYLSFIAYQAGQKRKHAIQ